VPWVEMERRTMPWALFTVISVLITLIERLASNVARSVEAEDPETSNLPRGVVVPMPTLPPVVASHVPPVVVRLVEEA